MIDGGDSFYEAIQEMAQFNEFKNTILRLPDSSIKKKGDDELVLRFFAVTQYQDGFKGNIEEWLDSLMEKILFKKIEFEPESQKLAFRSVFSLISSKLGDEAFTRFNDRNEATGRLAPAYYEAVVATFFQHTVKLQSIDSEILRSRLVEAFSSYEFKSATGPGANTIEKLKKRISIVSQHLLEDGNN